MQKTNMHFTCCSSVGRGQGQEGYTADKSEKVIRSHQSKLDPLVDHNRMSLLI